MRAPKTDTEIRKEQIAEAAMELITAGGLSGLSIAAVAARVGIVPSALYRHYKNRDAVLDAVMELLRGRMLANVEAACAQESGALERLRALLVRHMDLLTTSPAFPHVVFAHFSQADNAERRSVLHDMMGAYLQAIAQLVEQGQQEGAIRPDIPPRAAALMFIALILPAAMLHRISDGGFDPITHLAVAWPVFVRGLATDHAVQSEQLDEMPKTIAKTHGQKNDTRKDPS